MIINTLVVAFVTGLISSFGHCLGMCGGIVAIYSARQAALVPPDAAPPSILTRIRKLLPLHLGRIITYTILGALIGLAGSLLDRLGGMVGWQGIFSIIVGIAMIAVALSLMGVLPPIEAALVSVTGGASPMKRMRGLFSQHSFAAPFGR
jgi:sulfite exporter TauE/SafE